MKRIDRVVDLASRLADARDEVTRLEAELEKLLGGGKERAEKEDPVAEPATNGKSNGHGRAPTPVHAQVVELARGGLRASEIADKLGLEGRPGLVKVHQHMYRARMSGELPKVGAST